MFRRFSFLHNASSNATIHSTAYRALNPGSVLTVIRNEPGETISYYALRYFGPGTEAKVNLFVWTHLKKYGHVTLERDTMKDEARWYPNRYIPPRAPIVRLYHAEDYDLSVLKSEGGSNVEATKNISDEEDIQFLKELKAQGKNLHDGQEGRPVGRWMPPPNLGGDTAPKTVARRRSFDN